MKIGVYVTSLAEGLYGPQGVPERAHASDVGYDLRTTVGFSLDSGDGIKVPTGLVFDLPTEEFTVGGVPCRIAMLIEQRTGNGGRGLIPAATVVDAGYRPDPEDGSGLTLWLRNIGMYTLSFVRGDAVVQARFVFHPVPELVLVGEDQINWSTDRGSKRFGDTGR